MKKNKSMVSECSLNDAAEWLLIAARDKKACQPVRELIGAEDLEAAYKVQSIVNEERLRNGARLVGKKIGLTSEKVQKQIGVDQPDFGDLFDDMLVEPGTAVQWSELMQPKIESEIAFVLNANLDQEIIGVGEVLESIDHAVVALEIVGSRIRDWDIRITDTVADNASASHFVLGQNKIDIDDVNLIECRMKLQKNGETVSTGYGKDCMGSPINAVLWLARKMKNLGKPLSKGDVVLSGALGPMVAVSPGDHFLTSIEGLGEVEISFSSK
jgi:2-keto-4-pentenoate hydratase